MVLTAGVAIVGASSYLYLQHKKNAGAQLDGAEVQDKKKSNIEAKVDL